METCPNCSASVVVLLFDYSSKKRFCHNCVPLPPPTFNPEDIKFLKECGVATPESANVCATCNLPVKISNVRQVTMRPRGYCTCALTICDMCDGIMREGVEFLILRDGRMVCERCTQRCRRSNDSLRRWFTTREDAERFAREPANVGYHGDVAHICQKGCGRWHLSKLEWLTPASELVN